MDPLTVVWQTIAFGLLAAYLHELVHAGAALVLGRQNVRVHPFAVAVTWDVPRRGPGRGELLIGVAPFVTGLVLAPLLLIAFGLSIPLLVAWIVFTLNGIPNDFRVGQRVRSEAPET